MRTTMASPANNCQLQEEAIVEVVEAMEVVVVAEVVVTVVRLLPTAAALIKQKANAPALVANG